MGRDFRQRNDGTMRLVDDRPFPSPTGTTRRVKFLSLVWNVCKVFGDGWRHANNGWRVAVSREEEEEEGRSGFISWHSSPFRDNGALTLPPGHRRRPVSWASTMTGRGIQLRANGCYLADLPRERWSHRISRGTTKAMRRVSRFRGRFHLSTRGKFWIAFFFLLGTITITTFLVHSFSDPLSRGFVNFFFGRRISIWDITWYFRVSMKRKKREGMTDHFLPSSYQFIPRSLCMIIRGRVKNHDDTVISPVNTVTESVNNNP